MYRFQFCRSNFFLIMNLPSLNQKPFCIEIILRDNFFFFMKKMESIIKENVKLIFEKKSNLVEILKVSSKIHLVVDC